MGRQRTTTHILSVHGTKLFLDDKPFFFQGLSCFNALYNPTLNASEQARDRWLRNSKATASTFCVYGASGISARRGLLSMSLPHVQCIQRPGKLWKHNFDRLEHACSRLLTAWKWSSKSWRSRTKKYLAKKTCLYRSRNTLSKL